MNRVSAAREHRVVLASAAILSVVAVYWPASSLSVVGLVALLFVLTGLLVWHGDRMYRSTARLQNVVDDLLISHQAEQQARESAEAAVKQRDEFLSMASHELRSP